MASEEEVMFDPAKHAGIEKGSVVGEKGAQGFLIYAMPSVGAMDREEEALKDAAENLKTQRSRQLTAKGEKKANAKAHRQATLATSN